MDRNQALEIAKNNHALYRKAEIEVLFRNAPSFDAYALYGYKQGWYVVDNYSFSHEEVTEEKYDITQGGWAFI